MDLLSYEEIKYNFIEETNECNICNKIYSPKYMTQHKKTLLHLENAYEYYVENQIEEKIEDYII